MDPSARQNRGLQDDNGLKEAKEKVPSTGVGGAGYRGGAIPGSRGVPACIYSYNTEQSRGSISFRKKITNRCR